MDNLILIPGLLGSELQTTSPFFGKQLVWLSTPYLASYGPDQMQLAPNGLSPGPLASGACAPRGAVKLGIYEPAIQQLTAAGFTVDFWSYDWRKDPRLTATLFAQHLATKYKGKPFYVLAHSLGGLVARLAYGQWFNLQSGSTWLRSVYCGVPHGGTYGACANLAQAFAGWTEIFTLWNTLYNLSPLNSVKAFFGSGLARRLNETVSSWPAIYACLPSSTASWQNLDPNSPACVNSVNYVPYNPSVSQDWMIAALQIQSLLEETIGATRPPEVCVVGKGVNTADSANLPFEPPIDTSYGFTPQGDGVVPISRAILPGTFYDLYSTDHYGVINSGQVVANLPALLRQGLTANGVIEPPPLKQIPLADPPLLFIPPDPRIAQPYKQFRLDP